MDGAPHRLDALAHGAQLGLPRLPQRRRAQHLGDDARAMGRRVAVDGADGAGQLAQHAAGLLGGFADHAQPAAALAVQREILRERVGHHTGHARLGQGPHSIGVVVQAIAEALVGHVDEGDQAALAQHRNQRVPLGAIEVHAGRVVAAGVQQHDAAGRQAAHRGQHLVKAQAAAGVVVIGICVHREAGALENGAMVFPARVADPDFRLGKIALEEIGAHFQRARPAQRLHGGDAAGAARGAAGAEHQFLHQVAIGRQAGHRQVGARPDVGQQRGLGLAGGGHDGDAAGFVEIDADGQVDLADTGIFLEILVQAEDGVARIGLDVLEHGTASYNE
ncbi:Uncharacterised protein [Bordetella pertussis]|nr:Uncharacterised protein [Bordetella pertussis]CPK22505.1 Uncharacterised protein [Bordetella pertussis]CPL07351.1 Uncharacterised protein [Bordetella pertussis]CPM94792.1 Uncharacterised protein [Bordetella pertussis]CPP65612.1 Uncharacterised protein [Bordetella pertussis]